MTKHIILRLKDEDKRAIAVNVMELIKKANEIAYNSVDEKCDINLIRTMRDEIVMVIVKLMIETLIETNSQEALAIGGYELEP